MDFMESSGYWMTDNREMADLELTGWLAGYDAASKTEEMAD